MTWFGRLMRKKAVVETENKKPGDRVPDLEFEGHKFYILNPYAGENDPKRLSTARILDFTLALNRLGLMISRKEQEAFYDKVVDLAMSGKNKEIIALANVGKARLDLGADKDLYIALGKSIVLVDDEENETPNSFYNSLKNELCKNEVMAGFFFASGSKVNVQYRKILDDYRKRGLFDKSPSERDRPNLEEVALSWYVSGQATQLNKWVMRTAVRLRRMEEDILKMVWIQVMELLLIAKLNDKEDQDHIDEYKKKNIPKGKGR